MRHDGSLMTRVSLIERFAAWAADNDADRFWGIARLPDGRICLTLPTRVPEFRAVLITAEDTDEVWGVLGWARAGGVDAQQDLGHVDDDPGALFLAACDWALEAAVTYLSTGDLDSAEEAAQVSADLARRLGDTAAGARARRFLSEM